MTKNFGKIEEKNLVTYLNNKKFSELEIIYRKIISSSFSGISEDSIIHASSITGNLKPDLKISINNKINYYSLKTGSGNSIHQEPLDNFVEFSKKLNKSSEQIINIIKFFIWTDGTTDGSGKIQNRMDKKTLRSKYPKKLNLIKDFFFNNKVKIIERILLKNTNYLIFKKKNGKYLIKNRDWIFNKFNEYETGNYGLGPITFQTWNPSLKGQTKKPRDVVQFKWGKIEKDLDDKK